MSDAFSEAVIDYLGYGTAAWPQANADSVVDPLVRRKLDAMFEFVAGLEPDWSIYDLLGAGRWAADKIGQEFPFLTMEARDALAWSCTFGWK